MDQGPWHALSHFESRDLVHRSYEERHGAPPADGHAAEIAACFIQGRAYYESAQAADEAVRPLLLHYGVLALSRGTVLFLGKLREADLEPKHGLGTPGWKTTLAQGAHKLLELRIGAQEAGTYPQLLAATSNSPVHDDMRHFRRLIAVKHGVPVGFTQDKHLGIDDLLSRVPSLRRTYRAVTERAPRCFDGRIHYDDSATDVGLSAELDIGPSTDAEIRTLMRVPPEITIRPEPMGYGIGAWGYRIPHGPSGIGGDAVLVEDPVPLGSCFVPAPWPNGGYLSPLLRCHCISYFLGMLVRYFPSIWMALLRGGSGDRALPLMREATDHVATDFPALILRSLLAE